MKDLEDFEENAKELFEAAYKKINDYYRAVERDDILNLDSLAEFMDERPFSLLSEEDFENLINAVIQKIKSGWVKK